MTRAPIAPTRQEPKQVNMNEYSFRLPAETSPHRGTIIVWPTKSSILDTEWSYPGADVDETHHELAVLAQAIAKYEPVEVFVLDPDHSSDEIDGKKGASYCSAVKLLGDATNVTLHVTANVDCLWARDVGPVYVYAEPAKQIPDTPGKKLHASHTPPQPVGVILNFNQWGRKNTPTVDSYFAPTACSILGDAAILAPFIAEGGALETDGHGTMLVTESAILNPNRNPGVDKTTMESYFAKVFGIKKTIWLPGVRGGDVTDDHIDAFARFAPGGVVLLSRPSVPHEENEDEFLADYREAVRILGNERNAQGRTLKIIDLPEPNPKVLGLPLHEIQEAGCCTSYANFHHVNGAIILAKFGDETADRRAAEIVARYFPGRVVEQVPIRQIGIQGGGFHCATQQILA